MVGKLLGVGIGPGDPGLLTLKALEVIKRVDVICAPTTHPKRLSLSLKVVSPILKKRPRKPEVIQQAFSTRGNMRHRLKVWRRIADLLAEKCRAGKNVAYLVLGDPGIYSSFNHIRSEFQKRYPDIPVEVIPGITSITAIAAKAGLSLVERDQILAIVPTCYSISKAKAAIEAADTIVFMKNGKSIEKMLEKTGDTIPGDSITVLGFDVFLSDEQIRVTSLRKCQNTDLPSRYLSTIIVKKEN